MRSKEEERERGRERKDRGERILPLLNTQLEQFSPLFFSSLPLSSPSPSLLKFPSSPDCFWENDRRKICRAFSDFLSSHKTLLRVFFSLSSFVEFLREVVSVSTGGVQRNELFLAHMAWKEKSVACCRKAARHRWSRAVPAGGLCGVEEGDYERERKKKGVKKLSFSSLSTTRNFRRVKSSSFTPPPPRARS